MFRKLTIALGATAVIAAAALTPTTASAWGWHGHHGWHGWHGYHGWHSGFGVGFYAPVYAAGPDCYVVRRIVMTADGPQPRRVTVCD